MRCRWSVQVWCPKPREPLWIITATCPRRIPQAADLRVAALHRLLRDGIGIGAGHGAVFLGARHIVLGRQAALEQPWHAFFDQPPQLGRREPQRAAVVGTLRDAAHQLVEQLLGPRPHLCVVETGRDQAHAAVDVEADAARRHHAVVQRHGRHAADGEAVAPVDVRHRDAGADDAGQRRHVHDLLERLVCVGALQDLLRGIHDARHPHVALGLDAPGVLVDQFDVGHAPAVPFSSPS
jgi:hypothetical protein